MKKIVNKQNLLDLNAAVKILAQNPETVIAKHNKETDEISVFANIGGRFGFIKGSNLYDVAEITLKDPLLNCLSYQTDDLYLFDDWGDFSWVCYIS